MGRTLNKSNDDALNKRAPKHSKNIPGKGMRIINNWSEEIDDDELEGMRYHAEYDSFDDEDDKYCGKILQTHFK